MKKALFIIILFCLQVISSCGIIKSSKMQENNLETFEGIAQDTKSGAVIVTDENIVYYIDGLEYWEGKYLNKKLIVTGILTKMKGVELSDSILISQNIPSKIIIKQAKYWKAK